jgi:hypothetical protein
VPSEGPETKTLQKAIKQAAMGKGLKDVHVSYVGSHENSDKIPQWMKANGGTFSREINKDVTHLVASESAFKKNVDAGKSLSFDSFRREKKNLSH